MPLLVGRSNNGVVDEITCRELEVVDRHGKKEVHLHLATVVEIEAQGWSFNLGRYVRVAEHEVGTFNFAEQLGEFNAELEVLNAEAYQLEEWISENVTMIVEDRV